MNMPTEIFGDVIVVHAPEELGEDVAPQFAGFLDDVEQHKVIIDLDGTESLDSEGLTLLLDVQDSLRISNGDVKLIASNSVNRKILEITRLDQHLEVFDSVIDAVKSFV
jgi:anti-anti-sigma factor